MAIEASNAVKSLITYIALPVCLKPEEHFVLMYSSSYNAARTPQLSRTSRPIANRGWHESPPILDWRLYETLARMCSAVLWLSLKPT